MIGFCKHLKKKYNSRIYIYGTKNAKIFYTDFLKKNIIEEFIGCNVLHEKLFQKVENPEKVLKKSLKIENFIDSSLNLLRMTRRDLGLGFYVGARFHPKSPSSEKASYLQTVNAYCSLLEFWISELKEKKITVFLNGLKEEEFVCKALGIPYRLLFGSRIQNYWHWSLGMRTEFPQVKYQYNKLKNTSFKSTNLTHQYYQDQINKEVLFSSSPLISFLKKAIFQTHKEIYDIVKGNSSKKYFYFSYLKYLLNEFRHLKLLRSNFVDQINSVSKKKFVYFPLHTEPEMSLHWMSPECFNQIDVIMSIARDLPSDTYLVVKETIYSVGKRDKSFYQQIKDLKNTILLDVDTNSLEIIKKSSAVATISGSAGVEAAILGKPVLVFSKYTFFDFLPHVFNINSHNDNYKLLKKVLDKNFINEKIKSNGSRLQQAIINSSFDMKKFNQMYRDQFGDDVMLRLSDGLKKSFNNIV